MNLLKADAMWELKYYQIEQLTYKNEHRFILLRHWENGVYPCIVENGKVGYCWTATKAPLTKPNYWDELPKTEAEAWEHLPSYLKDE